MMLLGDLAVDGRRTIPERDIDYLLRDVSPVWKQFSANVPSYTSWDDHDYYGNDTGGKTAGKSGKHMIPVNDFRKNWRKQWNNPTPDPEREGIYFSTHLGPVHMIMCDTRSCRVNEARGEHNSFLGEEQMAWLKKELKESTASIILLSGGTMWSDYISNGKDSWGTWDTKGREEILSLIDSLDDKKVLLFSGDRHGTHAFKMPLPSGDEVIEFGVGTLGGVPGGGKTSDPSVQIFAYPGYGTWAYGELEFTFPNGEAEVSFHLINLAGSVIESVKL